MKNPRPVSPALFIYLTYGIKPEYKSQCEAAVGPTLQRDTVHPPCDGRLRRPTGRAFDDHVGADHAELTLGL